MKLNKSLIILSSSLFLSLQVLAAKGGGNCDDAPNCEGPQDKMNGIEICKDSKKVIRRKITFKDGKKNGPWECYNENGKLIESRNYKLDILDGLSKRYIDEIDKYEEVNFKNDLMNGTHKNFFTRTANGKTEMYEYFTAEYLDGNKHGWFIRFDANGKEIKRECYQNDNLERKNPEKCGDFKIKAEATTTTTKNSHQIIEKKDTAGNLIYQESRLDSRLEGPSKYYKKGVLSRETNYVNNQKNGLEKLYFESGNLKSKRMNTDDFNFDEYTEFYENQEVKLQVKLLKKAESMKDFYLYKFQMYSDIGKILMDGECKVGGLEEFRGDNCYNFYGKAYSYEKDQIIESTLEKNKLVKKVYKDMATSKTLKTEEYFADGSIKK